MNTDVIEKVKFFYQYLSVNGVIDLIVLGLATISANFLAYVYYFDINALAFVDATTITKHVLVISLHYAGALAVVSVILVIIQNIMTSREFLETMGNIGSADFGFNFGSILPRTLRFALWKILEKRMLRTTLAILLFCLIYIGLMNTIILLAVTIITIALISFLYLRFLNEKQNIDDTKSVSLLGGYFKMDVPTIVINDEIKKETGSYLLAKVGVIVLFLALSIGIGRANYIENYTSAFLEGYKSNSVIIVTNSNSGLILYDLNEKEVLFKPWSQIKGMQLPIESQRSLKTLGNKKPNKLLKTDS